MSQDAAIALFESAPSPDEDCAMRKACGLSRIGDIAVHPDHPKRGLSRGILERSIAFVDDELLACAVASLFADVDWLYQKFGFSKLRAAWHHRRIPFLPVMELRA
jgi:predicted GNAT family N-acyltransferase